MSKPGQKQMSAYGRALAERRWELFREAIERGELPPPVFTRRGPLSPEAKEQFKRSRLRNAVRRMAIRTHMILAMHRAKSRAERQKIEQEFFAMLEEYRRTGRMPERYLRWGGRQMNYKRAKAAATSPSS